MNDFISDGGDFKDIGFQLVPKPPAVPPPAHLQSQEDGAPDVVVVEDATEDVKDAENAAQDATEDAETTADDVAENKEDTKKVANKNSEYDVKFPGQRPTTSHTSNVPTCSPYSPIVLCSFQLDSSSCFKLI